MAMATYTIECTLLKAAVTVVGANVDPHRDRKWRGIIRHGHQIIWCDMEADEGLLPLSSAAAPARAAAGGGCHGHGPNLLLFMSLISVACGAAGGGRRGCEVTSQH
jgi:hypothetical protein